MRFRPRSRSPCAAPIARRTRKPILPRFGLGSDARCRSTKMRSCSGRRRRGWSARLAAHGTAPGLTEQDYRDRLALRARRHPAHEISRLLPDRRRLHQMGEGPRHSGRAGPRFGRGLARRLCAHDHRSRSAALRPAVRALPQPRARLDAGFRHRFLPGPARAR